MEILIKAGQLLLSLSILVVLHEFGHYAAARFFGCRVEKFYLFMDWGLGSWDGSLFKKKVGEIGKRVVFNANSSGGGIVGEYMDNVEADGTAKEMYTTDISDILDITGAPNTIDYFSLDVEGAESLILSTPFAGRWVK